MQDITLEFKDITEEYPENGSPVPKEWEATGRSLNARGGITHTLMLMDTKKIKCSLYVRHVAINNHLMIQKQEYKE